MCGRDVERGVPDRHRSGGRPLAGAVACESEEVDAVLTLTAERALARREEVGQAKPLHPSPRDRWRIAGQKRRPFEHGKRFPRARRQFPVARVGSREQIHVSRAERLAPAGEAGVDIRIAEAGEPESAARVRRRCVPGNVGGVRSRSIDLLQRRSVRFDVDVVMRQQQCAVDVEEHKPGQACTTASTASRSERT